MVCFLEHYHSFADISPSNFFHRKTGTLSGCDEGNIDAFSLNVPDRDRDKVVGRIGTLPLESTVKTNHPNSISIVNCARIDDTGNHCSGVWDRESVVDQKFGRFVHRVLPVEGKNVEERPQQVNPFASDVGDSEYRTNTG